MFQDELAASSYYEAAFYEDPSFEVDDYFSDWEYYSDDYYDDDPSVKQPVRTKGADAATKPRHAHPSRRTSLKPDVASFQGVVWKTPALERDQDVAIQIVEPGHGDKVALLENWREIFKSAQPALDKSRLKKRRTRETLASDASVADDEFPCDEDFHNAGSDETAGVLTAGSGANRDAGDAEKTKSLKPPSKVAVEVPVKRGRKRKAEVPVDESKQSKTNGGKTRGRPKKVASNKGDSDGGTSTASSGRVRRSKRQQDITG